MSEEKENEGNGVQGAKKKGGRPRKKKKGEEGRKVLGVVHDRDEAVKKVEQMKVEMKEMKEEEDRLTGELRRTKRELREEKKRKTATGMEEEVERLKKEVEKRDMKLELVRSLNSGNGSDKRRMGKKHDREVKRVEGMKKALERKAEEWAKERGEWKKKVKKGEEEAERLTRELEQVLEKVKRCLCVPVVTESGTGLFARVARGSRGGARAGRVRGDGDDGGSHLGDQERRVAADGREAEAADEESDGAEG